MVAPASPVPLTIAPVTSRVAVGAAGAVTSGAFTSTGVDALPAASVCTMLSGSPLAWGGLSGAV